MWALSMPPRVKESRNRRGRGSLVSLVCLRAGRGAWCPAQLQRFFRSRTSGGGVVGGGGLELIRLFKRGAFERFLGAAGTAHVRKAGPRAVPQGQVNKGANGFPDAVVLGARRGFERVAMCVDMSSLTDDSIRGVAPCERRYATPGLPRIGSAVLSWSEGTVLHRGAGEELVRELIGRPAQMACA